jgi:hypothetical protein
VYKFRYCKKKTSKFDLASIIGEIVLTRDLGDFPVTNKAFQCDTGMGEGVGVTIESYGKIEISYINVDNF